VAGGRDKPTARQGSSCPLAAVAPAAGGKDRLQPRRGRRNQTKGSLETCLGEMIRIAAPVATTRAIARGLARAVLATREDTTREVTTREATTREATTKAAQTREADANTTAKRSPTRTEGRMEPAEGRITLDATGAIQLGGETLDVATCSLQKGSEKAFCFSCHQHNTYQTSLVPHSGIFSFANFRFPNNPWSYRACSYSG